MIRTVESIYEKLLIEDAPETDSRERSKRRLTIPKECKKNAERLLSIE
jgi:hypothetical protein